MANTAEREILVKVHRYQPERGAFIQEYRVPMAEDEVWSVLNILEYIYQNLDSTLAFFHHAACRQAACGKCMAKINGKTALTCKEKVSGDLELAPYKEQVVRDLVCQ